MAILVTDATADKSASRRCVWRQDQPLGYTQEHRQMNSALDREGRREGQNARLERCREPSQPGQATGESGTEGGMEEGEQAGVQGPGWDRSSGGGATHGAGRKAGRPLVSGKTPLSQGHTSRLHSLTLG